METSPLTPRRLTRATLARQLLLRRERVEVVAAVRRVVALQAQEPASPYIALWNRIEGFDALALDEAFADRSIVKGHLMRIAMHAVAASDYPAFHEAMQQTLRPARLNDSRFTSTGLSSDDADALIPGLLAFARTPRAAAEMEAWLDQQLGRRAHPRAWWAIRHYAPLQHAPTGRPWSFGIKKAYLAADAPPAGATRADGLPWLVRRYLEGFGPATAQDVATFVFVHAGSVGKAIAELLSDGSIVQLPASGRRVLLDVPGAPLPPEDSPAPPRLLGMWDEILLAYDDRSRVIPPEHRKHVIRNNGDVLPTLLVDGRVVGVWRPVRSGDRTVIEASPFERLDAESWVGLESEASSLLAFLEARDSSVYRRYGHWWSTVPAVEVRLLGG